MGMDASQKCLAASHGPHMSRPAGAAEVVEGVEATHGAAQRLVLAHESSPIASFRPGPRLSLTCSSGVFPGNRSVLGPCRGSRTCFRMFDWALGRRLPM